MSYGFIGSPVPFNGSNPATGGDSSECLTYISFAPAAAATIIGRTCQIPNPNSHSTSNLLECWQIYKVPLQDNSL